MFKIKKISNNSSYYPETKYYPTYNNNFITDEKQKRYISFNNKEQAKMFLKKLGGKK